MRQFPVDGDFRQSFAVQGVVLNPNPKLVYPAVRVSFADASSESWVSGWRRSGCMLLRREQGHEFIGFRI